MLLRGSLIWLLMLAVAAYGHRGLVASWMGPEHRHVELHTGGMPVWLAVVSHVLHELRRGGHDDRLRPDAAVHHHGSVATRHHHGYERHHHGWDDATVVRLDGPVAEAMAKAASGSAQLPMALTTGDLGIPLHPKGHAWPRTPAEVWRDAIGRLADRPPRA